MWYLWKDSLRRWPWISGPKDEGRSFMPRSGETAFQLEQKSSGESKWGVFKGQKEGQCSWGIISPRRGGWKLNWQR